MPNVDTKFLKKVVSLAKAASQHEKAAAEYKVAAKTAAENVASRFVQMGIFAKDKKDVWIEKLASGDPSVWAHLLTKVAERLESKPMGQQTAPREPVVVTAGGGKENSPAYQMLRNEWLGK